MYTSLSFLRVHPLGGGKDRIVTNYGDIARLTMATAPSSLHTLRGHAAGLQTVCFKRTPAKDGTGTILISG